MINQTIYDSPSRNHCKIQYDFAKLAPGCYKIQQIQGIDILQKFTRDSLVKVHKAAKFFRFNSHVHVVINYLPIISASIPINKNQKNENVIEENYVLIMKTNESTRHTKMLLSSLIMVFLRWNVFAD